MKNLLVILIIFLSGLSLAFVFREILPMSVSSRHVLHLIFPPKDLYKPIVKDFFPFHLANYTKEYFIKPKYSDYYSLGFKRLAESPFEELTYKGVLHVEILSEDKKTLLAKRVEGVQALYKNEVELFSFPIPVLNKYRNIYLRITVIEPDEKFVHYDESFELVVGVSGRP